VASGKKKARRTHEVLQIFPFLIAAFDDASVCIFLLKPPTIVVVKKTTGCKLMLKGNLLLRGAETFITNTERPS
jgi:hypothetical protein